MKIYVETDEESRLRKVHWFQWEARRVSLWDSAWMLIPIGALVYYLTRWAYAAAGPAAVAAIPFILGGSLFGVAAATGLLLQIRRVKGFQNHAQFLHLVFCSVTPAGTFVVIRKRATALGGIFSHVLALIPGENAGWSENGILTVLSGGAATVVRFKLADLQGFSLDTSQIHAIGSGAGHPIEQVILANLGNGESETMCMHYGTRSEVAELRAILQREYINNRPKPVALSDADDPV